MIIIVVLDGCVNADNWNRNHDKNNKGMTYWAICLNPLNCFTEAIMLVTLAGSPAPDIL